MNLKNLISLLAVLLFTGMPLCAQLISTDLQISIINPAEGEVVPYGDTAKLMVSIKNIGSDDMEIWDTIQYKVDGVDSSFLAAGTLPVGDSLIHTSIDIWNDEGEDMPVDVCVYLDHTIFLDYLLIDDSNPLNDTSCVSIILKGESSLDINEIMLTQIVLYPNPAGDIFHLKLPDSLPGLEYAICDYSGREISKGEIDKNKQINVRQILPGFYLLRLKSEHASAVKKIIIAR